MCLEQVCKRLFHVLFYSIAFRAANSRWIMDFNTIKINALDPLSLLANKANKTNTSQTSSCCKNKWK